MYRRQGPRIDILKAHKKVLLSRFVGGSLISGLLMFAGWSAVFPGFLIWAEAPLGTRILIFLSAFFFDAICITALYRIYCEFSRLRSDISRSSKTQIDDTKRGGGES